MSVAVLALGSNLGNRSAYLSVAVEKLGACVRAVSSVYETDPVGPQNQGRYLNAVVIAEDSTRDAYEWLRCAQELEAGAGRERNERWGPRTLDVDVISVSVGAEPVLSSDPELILPHPRAHERSFVLAPWRELDPHAVLPGHGPISSLLGSMPHLSHKRREENGKDAAY